MRRSHLPFCPIVSQAYLLVLVVFSFSELERSDWGFEFGGGRFWDLDLVEMEVELGVGMADLVAGIEGGRRTEEAEWK